MDIEESKTAKVRIKLEIQSVYKVKVRVDFEVLIFSKLVLKSSGYNS